MPTTNPFEDAVLTALLDGDHPVLKVLRAQARLVTVKERDFTGVGFFTTFELPPDAQPVPGKPNLHLGDVIAQFEPLRHRSGLVLYVREGLLDFLEGFTYDDDWPSDPWPSAGHFTVTPTDERSNDLAALARASAPKP